MLPLFLLLHMACAPWDADGERSASEVCGSGLILDGSICVPASCGIGPWGVLAVDDDTVYVDISAPEGGDGNEDMPFSAIQPALDHAASRKGARVAVAAGTYPETLAFTTDHADVRLTGRCREMVILDASVGNDFTPGIRVDAGYGAVEVSDLTVWNASYVGLWLQSGDLAARGTSFVGSAYYGAAVDRGELDMEGCLIEGSTELGLYAIGQATRVTLRDTVVRNTRPNADGELGRGIEAQDGATLALDGCLVENNTEDGVYATNPGTRIALRDTVVQDTQPNGAGEFGWGINVKDGATLSAEGCIVDGNTDLGLAAVDRGTEVTLRDTWVTNTRPDADGGFGRGIEINGGATLSAEGCLIAGNANVGLFVGDAGSQATLRTTTVRDTRSTGKGGTAGGIAVQDGATLTAEGCVLDGNTEMGLVATDPGTYVTLRSTVARNTQSNGMGEFGRGIAVQDGVTLSVAGCLIEGNAEVGLSAAAPGTVATIEDTTVRGTTANGKGEGGRGIVVQDGAILSAKGCMIDANTDVGIFAANADTEVSLRQTTVKDTRPGNNGMGGRGIEASGGAALSVEDCLIVGNKDVGVFAATSGTRVVLRDTTVRETQADGNGMGGRGIEVQGGATLSAMGSLLDGNRVIGLFASDPGTWVMIRDSTVRGTKAGTDTSSSAASGLIVQDEARLDATGLVVVSNQGPGILVNDAGVMECVGCNIQDNQFAGAAALAGGTLGISDSSITGTSPNVNLLGGAGVYAWPWVGDPTIVTLTNNTIHDNPVAGVWLIGNGTFAITGNTVSGGIGEPFSSGSRCGDAILALDGVRAWDGSSGLLLQDNLFRNASGSGVFLDDSSALMSGDTYADNALDLVVQNLSCDTLPDYSEAPRRELCPLYSHPTCYEEFFFVALPAEPVDEEAILRPGILPPTP